MTSLPFVVVGGTIVLFFVLVHVHGWVAVRLSDRRIERALKQDIDQQEHRK